ncbi:polysaccharide deacetylase family protein [Micromonospora mirobrigensis]|uniref:Peptidoglycan/xylan/chitin deacetylase, PgdA/CDA1 family n=1 Tax=Micromonospora mirobrigensis TaxID=262898 RepID=A0A1C4VLL6_9ACTN|nr:polysaccharide deacetylase family protein [Micromonospora mirobrigensis]SCE84887.1 Peptidoglycan/xylan/chitin deacetylase, PgdA/CDA1 family [Micromonospora mirobrigensis]
MTSRAVSAICLSLLLALSGCGDPVRHVVGAGAGGPVPAASGTPAPTGPEPTSAPKPEPTPSSPPRPVRPTPPPPPKLRPLPKQLPADLRRNTGVRAVALTFDDGPSPAWTPQLLDQLRAAHVTATFCVVGVQVKRHPQLVARIVREGHQLCNHSWRHDMDLGRRPLAEIRADLVRTNRAIQAAAPGAKVPFFRQPGGRWTGEEIPVARQLGMRPLHWSVDPQDWARPAPPVITKRVTTTVRAGAVVLMHDGGGNRASTMAACRFLIPELKRRYGVTRLR